MGSRISQEQDRIGGQASVAARMPNQKHRKSIVLLSSKRIETALWERLLGDLWELLALSLQRESILTDYTQ